MAVQRSGIWGWPAAGLVLLCVMALLGAGGCDDEEPNEPPPDPVPEGSPYDGSAQVRFVHLAPSVANVSVELPLASPDYRVVELEGEKVIERVGEPALRSVTPSEPIGLTGFSRALHLTTTPSAQAVVRQGTTVLHDEVLEGLEADAAYLLALVESAGVTGLVMLPAWSGSTSADGQVQVGLFHAAAGLGTVDVALEPLEGGTADAQWAGLTYGASTLAEPRALAPGRYRLHVLKGSDPAPLAAPRELDLVADTSVQVLFAPAGSAEGELPRVVFVVDPAQGLEVQPEVDWQRLPDEMP